MSSWRRQAVERLVGSRALVVVILLLAWTLRVCCVESVPPGWRDDALINMHALSGQVLAGHCPLYFTGASGHEPLYHYVHAAIIAVLGYNALSGALLSAALGTLSVALLYVLARRLSGPVVAAVCSLTLSASFWSLMYSRQAQRHMSLVPIAVACVYLYCRYSGLARERAKPGRVGWTLGRALLVGALLGLSLYTYAGSRMLVPVPILMLVHLAVIDRRRLASQWREMAVLLAAVVLVAVPLGIAIAAGFSEEAAAGIGAEGRLFQLAVPIRELMTGNADPVIQGVLDTLGMFHTTGDPEWLYNIPGRPVLGWVGGLLLWVGVGRCVARWREPRCFLLVLWLLLGLLPGFVIVPPASLGHTILAQPAVYLIEAETLVWLSGILLALVSRIRGHLLGWAARSGVYLAVAMVVLGGAVRDLRDYFLVWPREGMVRLLHRADYREAAAFLSDSRQISDAAVASALLGPWDRLALEDDAGRTDLGVRLFNPDRALIWPAGEGEIPVLFTSWPDATPPISDLVAEYGTGEEILSQGVDLITLRDLSYVAAAAARPLARFANGLALADLRWSDGGLESGDVIPFLCTWIVERELELPAIPVVANPPPPGVYTGARLAVFTHLLDAQGVLLGGDDGLWVDPVTLQPGDYFVQAHRIRVAASGTEGWYELEIGLYDPKTGQRWSAVDADGQPIGDSLLVSAPAREGSP
jgi:4-amino-4-deoxy-L-arabinose transferase-like glycosyltransferase